MPTNPTTKEPTEHTESTTEAPTTYPTRTSPRTTAPTTYPTTPSVTPTTVDPDDDFVCPHGGNDLFPRPGHCNQFYLCKDGYPAKMYIFVSSRHPPDFIGFISRSATQIHRYHFFEILNRTVLTGLNLTHQINNASKVATSIVDSSFQSRRPPFGHLVPSLKYKKSLVDFIRHFGNTVYFARRITLQ